MGPPEKPRSKTTFVVAYVVLRIASFGMAAAFANLALNYRLGADSA